MTVGELSKMLEGVDPKMKIYIPASQEDNGIYFSPCTQDSGVGQFVTDNELDPEDIEEMELLGKEVPMEDVFFLFPCGFHSEKDHNHNLN